MLAWLTLACATTGGRKAFGPKDRAQLVSALDEQTSRARRAWMTRDASILIPDTTAGAIARTPQGNMKSAAEMRGDLQRRMDMTTRVDTVFARLDSVRVLSPDSVLAYSTQRFVRVIRLPEGTERQRYSTVIHEEGFARRAGHWTRSGPLREIHPRAWWAGETPPE